MVGENAKTRWLERQPPETRPAVAERILELYRAGTSYAAIARALDGDDVLRLAGGHWWDELVAQVVRRELGPGAPPPRVLLRRAEPQRASCAAEQTEGVSEAPWWWIANVRVPDDVAEFLEWVGLAKSTATLGKWGLALRRLTAFAGVPGACRLSDLVTRQLLDDYVRALAGAAPHPSTRSVDLIAVRAFTKFAAAEGWLARDFHTRLPLPRVPPTDPRPVPPELVPGMLRSLPRGGLRELRDRALVYFLLSTGCRLGEALALDRSALRRPDGVRVCGFKVRRMRTVYLFPEAWDAIEEYIAARGDRDAALFVSFRPPFERLHQDAVRLALRALRERFPEEPGWAYVTGPHVLRHTAATLLCEVTRDARLVQEVLGHSSMRTLHVYTAITDRRKREVYAERSPFARLLAGGPAAEGGQIAEQQDDFVSPCS